MTGNALNARNEALELHELSAEALDAVAGGSLGSLPLRAVTKAAAVQAGGEGGQTPAEMWEQLMQQLRQGAN